MKINIYDEKLNRILPIEDRYVSCFWSEGYNTVENFTLELQATEEIKRKVKVGCYVGRDDRPTIMIINSVEYRDGKIVASGKQATRLLDDIAMMGTITYEKPFEEQFIKEFDKLEQEKTIGTYTIKAKVLDSYGSGITVSSSSTQLNGELKNTSMTDAFKSNRPIRFEYRFEVALSDFSAGDQLSFDIKSFPSSIYADGMEIKPNIEALENVGVKAFFYYSGIQGMGFEMGMVKELGQCLKVEGNQIRITDLNDAKPFLTDAIDAVEIVTDYFKPKDIYSFSDKANVIAIDVGFFPSEGSVCTIKPVRDKIGTSVEMMDFKSNQILTKPKVSISNTSFLDACTKECQALDYGLKVTKQSNRLVAEFYQPMENSENIFSEAFGNLKLDTLLNSNENYKNYAIVLGSGVGSQRLRMDVDLSNGNRISQMVVDARDLQFDEGDPWRIISKELDNRGMQKLLEQVSVQSIGFKLSDKDFGTRYDLGDIITARINSFDMVVKARIVRFTQKSQGNITETVVEVGNLVFVKKER